MSQWLKQNTAVTVVMGPFVDSTDGVTPEIALDITEQEVLLSKNGGAFALKHEATHGVHDASHNGWYTILLDATDTNTLGLLDIAINMAGAVPVWKSFMVVTADAWDSFLGAVVIGQAGSQAALVANNLDHLCKTATAGVDMTTEVTDGSVISRMISSSDTSAFVPATHSMAIVAADVTATHVHAAAADTATIAATIQADCNAALVANNLDHLALTATGGVDMTAEVADGTILSRIISNSDTSLFVPATHSLQIVGAASATAAAYAIVNSGLGFRGTVTAIPGANQFTISTLAGLGAGAFADAVAPWYALVFRDAGGLSAAPQGEFKKVTAYVTATGAFTTEAFTAAVAAGDDIIIINPRLSDLASIRTSTDAILIDTGELQTDWHDGGRLDLLLDSATAPGVWDLVDGIEVGLTPRQAVRIISAALAGKVSGAGTVTVTFRNAVVDGTDRIVATVDANGNRTAIAYDLA